uniref:Uncharacterized protein n=1 Tax=Solanum tuberosum TaxID=4113 RepID=M1CD35_SOLTU
MLQISEVQGVTSTIKDMEVYRMAGEVEINEGFQGEDCNIITEEVIPLGIQFPEENYTQTATPAWIQQHIMRLSKEFGVDFKGCEEKAAELFQKIDRNKLENKDIQNEQKCGEWGQSNSYFKFENWWLHTEGFNAKVRDWWESFNYTGRPDYVLMAKLKALKGKLKEWRKTIQGNLKMQKANVLKQLADLEEIQEQRALEEREIASSVWRSISDLWDLVLERSYCKVGNGRKVAFWMDKWCGQVPLSQRFPDLYDLCQMQQATIAELWNDHGWNLHFRRNLNDWEMCRITDFLVTLAQFSNLSEEEDSLV